MAKTEYQAMVKLGYTNFGDFTDMKAISQEFSRLWISYAIYTADYFS